MRTTDNFDHEPPRKAAGETRAANTAARNQTPRQPVRRPPVQVDNDSYDDDLQYDEETEEQEDQYDPEYDDYDDYDDQARWYDSFWFICICLVICPPYALYRIWKDERFSLTNRWLISAIDVCWLLIILILLFSLLFGRDKSAGSGDGLTASPTQAIDISTPTPDPNASEAPTPDPAVTADPNATTAPTPDPNATLVPGTTAAPTGIGGAITLPTQLPGSTQLPASSAGATVTLKPSATSTASTGTSSTKVWYTSGGTYYHSDSTCGGTMSGATQHTLEEAQNAGKRRCPYCYDGVSRTTVVTAKPQATARVTAKPTVRVTAKPTVRVTAAPTPQPTPVSTSPYAVMVYFNVNGEYYHSISNCQGMKNAGYYTIGQAIDAGKKRCPVCNAPEPGSTVTPSPSPVPTPTPVPTPVVHIVWYRADSTWYHAISNCQGMAGATRHTLGEAIDDNKQPCPVCNPPRQ